MSAYVEQDVEQAGWQSDSAHFVDRDLLKSLGKTSAFAERPPAAFRALSQARRVALLDRVIATQILPRIASARRAAAAKSDAPVAVVTTEDDTNELVRLLLMQEVPQGAAMEGGLLVLPDVAAQPADCFTFIALLRRRGATPESLYLGILTDAARCIGKLWEADRCDFLQVTISLGRLQQLARALAPSFLAASVSLADAPSLLLVPARGEQHTLGLLILAEFFRRAGWRVAGGPASSAVEPAAMVRDSWFDVAGFSIGSESLIEGLTRSIRDVRRASRNRDLGVMVGGPLFLHRPDLVTRVGADTAAADAPGAVRQATGLLMLRAAAD
jgi:methanogenic corrinoid protein MtbC1